VQDRLPVALKRQSGSLHFRRFYPDALTSVSTPASLPLLMLLMLPVVALVNVVP